MFQNLESSEFKRLKKHNKKKPAWVFEATRNKLPPLLLRFQIWLADNSGLWKTIGNQSLSIILEACPYRVVRGSTASPHSWHKWHPTRFVPHINWRKKRANVVNKTGARWNGRTFRTNEAPLENSKYPPYTVNRSPTITFVWLFVRVCLLFAKQPWKYEGCLGVRFSEAPSGGCYC